MQFKRIKIRKIMAAYINFRSIKSVYFYMQIAFISKDLKKILNLLKIFYVG